jgi:indolepyruvate ferredoxin oxidoreductase, beta subunit
MKKHLSKMMMKDMRKQTVQKCPDARCTKTEERGVYGNTLSDEVCRITPQMSGIQQSVKDPTNVIITGVGGQGNVLASRLLAGMLVRAGFRVTIGETFGMSQRGGSVMSHLRISQRSVRSPQIPHNGAHIIIALEPVEALRVLTKYGNPDVVVLANSRVVYPIGVITGELNYPSVEEIQNILQRMAAKSWLIDATSEAVKLGNPVLSNVIMIGALSATGLLPISRNAFAKEIAGDMKTDRRRTNLLAFAAGRKMI